MAKIISLKCPECGATLDVEEGKKFYFCNYCGSKILIDDGNTNNTNRIVDEARIREAEIASLYSLAYILLLMAGCMVCAAKYSYIGNIWSNFTIYYKSSYEKLLSDNNRFIDQQVFKYYSPYQAVIHGVVLLLLCMVLMGTVTLYFSIMNKKLVAILLNVISILFVLIFNNYRIGAMWLSPFCHAVLALHNRYVYTEFSVSLGYSYAYLVLLEIIMIGLSIKQLKKKMFY